MEVGIGVGAAAERGAGKAAVYVYGGDGRREVRIGNAVQRRKQPLGGAPSGTGGAPVLPARERGVALLIVLFVVSFLLVFVAANSNALFNLRREIKLVDQKQKARWSEVSRNPAAARVQEVKQ